MAAQVYVDRDKGGKVTSINKWKQYSGQEEIAEDHADVSAFLNPPDPVDPMDAVKQAVKDLANGDPTAAKALV